MQAQCHRKQQQQQQHYLGELNASQLQQHQMAHLLQAAANQQHTDTSATNELVKLQDRNYIPQNSMASFAIRLMSLTAYELRCLNADTDLMRHLNETQMLIESRLNDLHSSRLTTPTQTPGPTNATSTTPNVSATRQDKFISHYQQHQQQYRSLDSPLNLNNFNLQSHIVTSNNNLDQQSQATLSPNSYYNNNYYAQQLMLAQMAQMQQHQQLQQQRQHQYLLQRLANDAGDLYHSQHHQGMVASNLSDTISNTSESNFNTAATNLDHQIVLANSLSDQVKTYNHPHSYVVIDHQQTQQPQINAPALDLRTTPTRPQSSLSTCSTSPPMGRAESTSSRQSSSGGTISQPYKKWKVERNRTVECKPVKVEMLNGVETDGYLDQNRRPSSIGNGHHKRGMDVVDGLDLPQLNSNRANVASSCVDVVKKLNTRASSDTSNIDLKQATHPKNGKKHKGEFDEPTLAEVALREQELNKPQHYHKDALDRGECACILGSEFPNQTHREVLEMIDQWRSMSIGQRINRKWDVKDLPKDIPLSDIKKFEDLRREFSDGRADFGGASKRKPLGIRGTRQFLLILYCLWGHPGRDDVMQRDGYCPHCFAKIKSANEQSTLVRVVNHFNMKHRRGANPRLSPQLDNNNAASICDNPNNVSATLSENQGAYDCISRELATPIQGTNPSTTNEQAHTNPSEQECK